jgi:C_GCAxxG_C_C family probable redox protein
MNELDQIKEYRKQGFYCSQIILLQGLDLLGKQNPDLVRSMNGLAGGLGFSGELCGALTGGACLLGLYAGKGVPEQEQDPRLDFMVMDLVKWFKAEYEPRYGGIRCEQILNGDRQNQPTRCPFLVIETFQKVKELLVENGFDLSGLET